MRLIYSMDLTNKHKHLFIVTTTHPWRRLFRTTYWVRCWECDIKEGPYYSREDANQAIVIAIGSELGYGTPLWP